MRGGGNGAHSDSKLLPSLLLTTAEGSRAGCACGISVQGGVNGWRRV